MSIEEENELKQFLKVARPDWSLPKRKGHNDIHRACEKLKAIGVQDVSDLLHRVTANTINDDLSKAHKPRFSRETIQSIRREGAFWQSLSHLNEPSYRQVGLFAPVPQMLAGRNLRIQALKSPGMPDHANIGMLHPVTGSISSGKERLRSAGSSRSSISVRPSTMQTADFSASMASSAISGDSPRIRPSSKALRSPYMVNTADGMSDGGDSDIHVDVLPRLRHALPKPVPGHGLPSWKRRSLAMSQSCPEIVHEELQLPPPQQDHSRGSIMSCAPRRLSETGGSSLASTLLLPGMGSSASIAASNASVCNASVVDDETELQNIQRWNSAGTSMTKTPLTPGWCSSTEGTLLQHGEAMIREQEDLQHKKKLYQQIRLEGKQSPMRQHLAEKISTRMREEKLRDVQAAMEVQQSCMSIKKDITSMTNLRKDLHSLRMETQHTLCPQRMGPTGLSLDLFTKMRERPYQLGTDDDAENPDGAAADGTAEENPELRSMFASIRRSLQL